MAHARSPLVFCTALVICGCSSIPTERGWFMGAGIGHVSTALQSCYANGGSPTVTVNSCGVSGTNTGGKVFGGYQFNRYLAVEGGIADLGTLTENWSGSYIGCCGTSTTSDSDTSRMVGAFVHAIGTLPITKEFGVLGWVGPQGPREALGVGVGVKYDFNEKVGVRVEYGQYYGTGPLTVNWRISLTSVSVVYYFRKK